MRQQGLSVVAPIQNGRVEELRELLERVRQQVIDEMNGEDSADHLIRFNDTPTHFARLVLIDQDPGYPPQLLFASNHDGDGNKYLDALIAASTLSSGENGLDLIWGHCKGYPEKGVSDPTAFKRYMYDHTFKNQTYYVCYPGITKESALNAREVFFSIGGFLDENRARLERLPRKEITEKIRDYVKKEVAAGRLTVMTESIPPIPTFFRLFGNVRYWVGQLLTFVPAQFLFVRLRRAEKREREEFERTHTSNYVPSDLVLRQESREDLIAQNQMTLITPLKTSPIRRLLLRIFLRNFNYLAKKALNQGNLGGIRTIHFARWFYTDGGERLIFNTQFDGSWQQYVDDSVGLLPLFQTGIWSNVIRFPPSKNLFFEGATDIESFMQFIREFQIPSDVFYSAYSDFAAQNIVNAVRMREGLNDLLAGKTLKDPEAWLRRFAGTLALPNQKYPRIHPSSPEDPKVKDHLEDIQAWILTGYVRATHAGYLFLKITDAPKARRWLGEVAERTTQLDAIVLNPVNVAFTAGGLKALGLPEDALLTFPTEFRQGIAQEYYDGGKSRSRKLGDTGQSAPEHWEIGGSAKPFDVLVVLHAKGAEALKTHTKAEMERIQTSEGLEVVFGEIGRRLTKKIEVPTRKGTRKKTIFIEHFGFRDGIAEPVIRDSGFRRSNLINQVTIAAGEFILGYKDQHNFFPPTPSIRNELDPDGLLQRTWRANARKDLGRNGTFVVFRKLPQDVPAFWKYFAEQTRDENGEVDKGAMIKLASKSVGRWPNGVPLTLSPDKPDPYYAGVDRVNNFLYVTDWDPYGYRCPFASHIRRSNPRDSLSTSHSLTIADRHRIIKRGIPYGQMLPLPPWEGEIPEDDGEDRGAMFFCFNTSFRRQFEFIQSAWINNPRFNGLYNTRDPLVGNNPDNPEDLSGDLTLEAEPYRRRIQGIPRFTRVKGGAYLFLPSISALRLLARLPGE